MRNYGWKLAALGCLSVIFFSSTSTGGEWAMAGFRWMASRFLVHLHEGTPPYRTVSFLAEKCFHLIAFAVFAMLVWKVTPEILWKPFAILALGLAVGIASELLQSLFPGRDPTVRDVAINLAGTVLGAAISMTCFKSRSQPLATS